MKRPELEAAATRRWYGHRPAGYLRPLAFLYGLIVAARRAAYRSGLLRSHRLGVPVIVVGNLTVGGTGKTPVVAWLARQLRAAGHRPGIVSRGYGGRAGRGPQLVSTTDAAELVGDEPLLLAREAGVPVCVGSDRVAAARRLLAEGVDLIIADDGLQHLRLARDLEIVVLDGGRRLGNGALLPAGPLREPARRLAEVDFVLVNGEGAGPGETAFRLEAGDALRLDGGESRPVKAFAGQRVRVVAGIGNPGRFLRDLAARGIDAEPVPVADHGRVDLAALLAADPGPILMTSKDAVKYPSFPSANAWVVPVETSLPQSFASAVLARLASRREHSRDP